MGKDKQDGLWDDSALINAFNDAISKYKIMHSQESQTSSGSGGKVIISKEEKISALIDEPNDTGRHAETNDESKISSITTTEIEDIDDVSTVKGASSLESEAPENHVGSCTEQNINHEPVGHLDSQSTEDYNQLLSKYYELEDQRQKILQQLNQFGYWNYDFGLTTVTSQDPEASISQTHPSGTSSVCPYGCQSWVAPCTALPCYCSSGACVRKSCNAPAHTSCTKDAASSGDTDVVKTAMVAAERALSSLKEQDCTNSQASANEGKEKQSETGFCHVENNANSETDLAVVLNAWYSAGFHTGKYLSEQSYAKNRQG